MMATACHTFKTDIVGQTRLIPCLLAESAAEAGNRLGHIQGRKSNGNHAVVFERYGEQDGKKGMYVLEQARRVPTRTKFIPFNAPNGKPIYQAEKYSVIRKP